jgi:hypothetical protein
MDELNTSVSRPGPLNGVKRSVGAKGLEPLLEAV